MDVADEIAALSHLCAVYEKHIGLRWDVMTQSGIKPNRITYNILISSCAKAFFACTQTHTHSMCVCVCVCVYVCLCMYACVQVPTHDFLAWAACASDLATDPRRRCC